jgi:hypothetical protein
MAEPFNCPYDIDENDILHIHVDLKVRPKKSGSGKTVLIASTHGTPKLIQNNKHRKESMNLNMYAYNDITDSERLQRMIDKAKHGKEKNKRVLQTLEACKEALEGRHYQFKALFNITDEVE